MARRPSSSRRLWPVPVGQALPDAISINPLTEIQPATRQAEPDLRGIESQAALIDEVLTDNLINDLRVQEEEEDLLAALIGKQESDQQEEDSLFAELGRM